PPTPDHRARARTLAHEHSPRPCGHPSLPFPVTAFSTRHPVSVPTPGAGVPSTRRGVYFLGPISSRYEVLSHTPTNRVTPTTNNAIAHVLTGAMSVSHVLVTTLGASGGRGIRHHRGRYRGLEWHAIHRRRSRAPPWRRRPRPGGRG